VPPMASCWMPVSDCMMIGSTAMTRGTARHEGDAGDDAAEVLLGGEAGAHAGDERRRFSAGLRDLVRVERHRGVEVGEKKHEHEVESTVHPRFCMTESVAFAAPASHGMLDAWKKLAAICGNKQKRERRR